MGKFYPNAEDVLNEIISAVANSHQEGLADDDMNLRIEDPPDGESDDYVFRVAASFAEAGSDGRGGRAKFVIQVIQTSDRVT